MPKIPTYTSQARIPIDNTPSGYQQGTRNVNAPLALAGTGNASSQALGEIAGAIKAFADERNKQDFYTQRSIAQGQMAEFYAQWAQKARDTSFVTDAQREEFVNQYQLASQKHIAQVTKGMSNKDARSYIQNNYNANNPAFTVKIDSLAYGNQRANQRRVHLLHINNLLDGDGTPDEIAEQVSAYTVEVGANLPDGIFLKYADKEDVKERVALRKIADSIALAKEAARAGDGELREEYVEQTGNMIEKWLDTPSAQTEMRDVLNRNLKQADSEFNAKAMIAEQQQDEAFETWKNETAVEFDEYLDTGNPSSLDVPLWLDSLNYSQFKSTHGDDAVEFVDELRGRWEKKIEAFRKPVKVSDNDAWVEVNQAIFEAGKNLIPKSKALDTIQKYESQLTQEDAQAFRQTLNKEYSALQVERIEFETREAETDIVSHSPSDISAAMQALSSGTAIPMQQARLTQNQVERWMYRKAAKEMSDVIALMGKEDASPQEITDYIRLNIRPKYHRPWTEAVLDFAAETKDEVLLAEPPDKALAPYWRKLTTEQKANVVSLVAMGQSVGRIIQALKEDGIE